MLMNWYDQVYTGQHSAKDVADIRRQLEEGDYPRSLWLILTAANGRDLFDIRPAADLRKPYFKDRAVYVVGVARSRAQAVAMIGQVVLDYLAGGELARFVEYAGRHPRVANGPQEM